MKYQIAIVDDEEAVRAALTSVLSTYGFGVTSFGNAQAAVESFAKHPPHCVILDVRMPQMDGFAALKLIRELPDVPPVIFLTGHGDVAMAVAAMKNGAQDFIEKPVDDEQLVAAITAAIEGSAKARVNEGTTKTIAERFAALTPREGTIARLVAEGYSTAAIALKLQISARTVDHHRASILAKMQATSLPQLLRFLLAVI